MGKAEKVKGGWPFGVAILWPSAGPSKLDESRLVRMQRQAIFGEALRQHFIDPACILFIREHDDGVVRVAEQPCITVEARFYLALEPLIEHRVQEDVRQERRNNSALRRSRFRCRQLTVLEHPCIEPLANQPYQHSINHPLANDFPQLVMWNRIEVLSNVDLDDPPASHLHRLAPQVLQQLVRAATGAKAVRAG